MSPYQDELPCSVITQHKLAIDMQHNVNGCWQLFTIPPKITCFSIFFFFHFKTKADLGLMNVRGVGRGMPYHLSYNYGCTLNDHPIP